MTKSNFTSIDEFIQTFPKEVQVILLKVRQTIQKAAPTAIEGFSYGVPAFKLNGENVVLFAAFKNHIGLYPDPPAIEAFNKDLTSYELSKGTIKFPLDKPIPYPLITKIVRFKMKKLSK